MGYVYVVFSSTDLGRETEAINSKMFHSKFSDLVSETFLVEKGNLEKRRKGRQLTFSWSAAWRGRG